MDQNINRRETMNKMMRDAQGWYDGIGDIPCGDCETTNNPVWYTDSALWNDVMGGHASEEASGILCPQCFMRRAENKYLITGWHISPGFNWVRRGLGEDP